MNADLMKVLSVSQQRCLLFWKNKKERIKIRYDSFFVGKFNDSPKSEVNWSLHHSRLLEKLVDWRREIARNEGTMPGLVSSTDFLIAIARQRPASYSELRRLSYFLPELLMDEQTVYLRQLFELLQAFGHDDHCLDDEAVKIISAHKVSTSVANHRADSEVESTNAAKREEKFVEKTTTSFPSEIPYDQAERLVSPAADDDGKWEEKFVEETMLVFPNIIPDEEVETNTITETPVHPAANDDGQPSGFSRYYVSFFAIVTVGAAIEIVLSRKRRCGLS